MSLRGTLLLNYNVPLNNLTRSLEPLMPVLASCDELSYIQAASPYRQGSLLRQVRMISSTP